MRHRPAYLAILILAILVNRLPAADAPLADLDNYVSTAMAQWEVPGLAMAVVKDDKVVFAKGFGKRKLGEDKAVDAETLFAIGSSSKAFTAAAIGMLCDDDKLSWDHPVQKHIPDLQLHDPYVTRELTIRDLLCHRCGLPRGDFIWYGTIHDRSEVLRRARFIKPQWSFRSHFGYQNIMFLVAGEVVGKTAGIGWDDFVKQRLFLPLGMKSSNTSVASLSSSDNVATPHSKIEKSVQPIAWRNIDNVGPAGSINSNVTDMAQWVRLQLGEGSVDGKRLISGAAIKEMQAPQTVIPRDKNYERIYPDAHFLAYGLGWFLHDYQGRKVVEHGGAIDGMRAEVALLPEEKLGLVILCNRGGTALPSALAFHVFDLYLKAAKRDWSADLLGKVKELEKEAEKAQEKEEAERAKETKPSLDLSKYAGSFSDDLYGDAEVKVEDGKLTLTRGPNFVADLEHWHYDTFRAKYRDRVVEPQLVTFDLDESGKVAGLKLATLGRLAIRPVK
jgi:CubicO group peptidase (beta-lactamase class C family)